MKKTLFPLMALGLVLSLARCGSSSSESAGFPKSDIYDSADADSLVPESESEMAEGVQRKRNPTKLPSVISSARALAENLMGSAAAKAGHGQESQLFQSMQQALSTAKIHLPSAGHDLKACREDAAVLAYVNLRTPHTIHVCRRAEHGDKRQLAQILTHETAHVVGVHNECSATRVEVAVMRLSGAGLGFRNGYMDPCRIR